MTDRARRRGYLTKTYDASLLLDNPSLIEERIKNIEIVTHGLVFFKKFGSQIIRYTRILKARKIDRFIESEEFSEIEETIAFSHSLGLVHGDINWKNIVYDGDKLTLVDWEPSLKQVIMNRPSLMYTSPNIHPEDLKFDTLTERTDLLCLKILKCSQNQIKTRK